MSAETGSAPGRLVGLGAGPMRWILAFALTWLAAAPPAAAHGPGQIAQFASPRVDLVVVVKHLRELHLLAGHEVVRTYRIALGRYPEGPKKAEGDARTPEGRYTLDYRFEDSDFYKAIHISYPNTADRARARRLGVDPGGRIMIHGLPDGWTAKGVGHPDLDWTQGCIAVTNRELDEIWNLVHDGTPIEIYP